jgi:hypothetical protein
MDKSDHIAIKSSRDRLAKHEGVKSVTIDPFSVVLYRFINVTKELALQDIKGYAKTFKLPFIVQNGKLVLNPLTKSARTLLIENLKERMALYDVGVPLDLVELLLDPAQWTPYDVYFVCLKIGEVMNQKGKLIGSLKGNKMGNIFLASRKSGFQRSHIVLLASGQQRPSDDYTADHIVSSQTLNDSTDNLQWATNPEQRFNQGVHVRTKRLETYTGKLLPLHPQYGKQIKLSSDGFIRIGNRNWGMGTENKGSGYFKIKLNGRYTLVHVLMVECILGRVLTKEETVDHIDGNHGSNLVSNLAPVFGYDNIAKSVIKLVTRIDSAGNAVVFGGGRLAAEATPGTLIVWLKSKTITRAINGRMLQRKILTFSSPN